MPTQHALEMKVKAVEDLKIVLKDYPNVGVLNFHKLPAAQLGQMRKSLHGKAKIIQAKKSTIERALPENMNDLKKHLSGQPALILTDENPFKLYKYIQNNKTKAPAKIGDVVPSDIVVPAGDTGIPPGPAIGTFGQAGVIASVKSGSIHILKDTPFLKTGEKVTPEKAQVLGMLKIEPMEIGLDFVAIYENGTIFDKTVLHIDETEFMTSLNNSIRHALNLSVEVGYPTKQTIDMIIAKAARQVKSLALEAGIYSSSVINDIISKAYREMLALAEKVPAQPAIPSEPQPSQSPESQSDSTGGAK